MNYMENSNEKIVEKINSFFKTSLEFFGKEIGLVSNQEFSITQIRDKEREKEGKTKYMIQYGFPQSGCVSVGFSYSEEDKSFSMDNVSVFAPPAGEPIMMANFAPQEEIEGVSIKFKMGMDMGTEKHETLKEIEENPNALKMIDIAIRDLSRAQILGECMLAVPVGSDYIPCCNSTQIPKKKGRTV